MKIALTYFNYDIDIVSINGDITEDPLNDLLLITDEHGISRHFFYKGFYTDPENGELIQRYEETHPPLMFSVAA